RMMRKTHAWKIAFATAIACVIIVAVSSPLLAADDVIYGCVNRNGANKGQVRIVDATEACSQNENRIQWNVTGPPGPKGDKGDKGVTGHKGDPGASTTAGSISGTLACSGFDYTGYLVYTPGRAFNVLTGSDGVFQMDGVPPGTYTLSVMANGQQKKTLQTTV